MDAFVAKIATNGWSWTDLRYSTYIGGTKEDFGYDITLNSDGDIYIIGTTDSSDFPVNPGSTEKPHGFGPHGYNHDSFVTKLVLNGYDSFRLGYTIFIGGSGDDWGKSIFVDDSGNIYITGTTQSEDFPTTNGAYQTKYGGGYTDVFVCKFSEGTMVPLGDQTIQGPFDFTRIKEILKQIADEIIRIFRGLWPIK